MSCEGLMLWQIFRSSLFNCGWSLAQEYHVLVFVLVLVFALVFCFVLVLVLVLVLIFSNVLSLYQESSVLVFFVA